LPVTGYLLQVPEPAPALRGFRFQDTSSRPENLRLPQPFKTKTSFSKTRTVLSISRIFYSMDGSGCSIEKTILSIVWLNHSKGLSIAPLI
jgi:hypothetical protein